MSENCKIKIIGVGGAGIAVLGDIASEGLGAQTAAVDTDARAVANSAADIKIALIENGEGSGSDTSIAKEAAVAHAAELAALPQGARLLIIIAGLGGGTGSVVAPMISKIAAGNPDCAVVSFAIMPLSVEGAQRASLALRAQTYLSKHSRAAFALRNDVILARLAAPISEAFAVSNMNVVSAVSSLVKMLTSRGIVNVDFPSFTKIFSRQSKTEAFLAYGTGEGANAVEEAAAALEHSPLAPGNVRATAAIVSLRCGKNFEMNKMQRLLEAVSGKYANPERMAFGAIAEDSFGDNIEVCVMGLCKTESPEKSEAKTEEVKPAVESASEESAEEKTETPADSVSETVRHAVAETQPTADIGQATPTAPVQGELAGEPQPEDAFEPQIDEVKTADDSITSSENIKVDAPAASSAANSPAPVLAEAEPKTARKPFFSFGRRKKAKAPEDESKAQTEFKFMELSQQRGFFQDTPPNMRNGVDLDVPTFMRKGIKIVL